MRISNGKKDVWHIQHVEWLVNTILTIAAEHVLITLLEERRPKESCIERLWPIGV